MTEILLGVLAEHLAFVTANWAFDNNFWTRSRRSIHIGWGHTVKTTRSEHFVQDESTLCHYFKLFSSKYFLAKIHGQDDFK
jgi:hypothetical protein